MTYDPQRGLAAVPGVAPPITTGRGHQPIINEVFIGRVTSRRWRERWRWDVTFQQPIDCRFPGVYDCRLHQFGEVGYALTARGAAIAVGKVIRRAAARDRSRELMHARIAHTEAARHHPACMPPADLNPQL